MLARDGGFLAVRGDRLLRWSPGGYVSAGRRPRRGDVQVLTPPTVLDALALGYEPAWHPSAAALVRVPETDGPDEIRPLQTDGR